ncbi:glycogen debranching protein GlgX [Gordonia jinhuaensis]|uniref:Glycogen operon protein GlgX homolog n=2 Tax=Gordonia jinhuaensis TaxID=1517702 RepID=A0A916WRK1_9ACTN|nr:glycogen operon protein GlgX homolog [Gordonia jinhuaensis]
METMAELHTDTALTLTPGAPFPLGATPTASGVNFAVHSSTATQVFLQLFDESGTAPSDTIALNGPAEGAWHVHVDGIKAGQRYGYRAVGDYDPAQGMRFTQAKLLVDPYAKAVTGKFVNSDNLLLAYDADAGTADLTLDNRDSASVAPQAIVVDDAEFDWKGDVSPALALEELVIYEVHLKGFTAHESSGVSAPGTYLGFIDKIDHLRRLGINAVELLPIHEKYVDDFLVDRGLTNYWGYNTIGFFAPESSFAAGDRPGAQVTEFKTLVRALHQAGMKVILDVVFNHTGEGNEMGPTMSFRGIDNQAYYILTGDDSEPRRYYMNYSGCGNTLDFDNPTVLALVMDSLRYWVEQMHVDGFRFDLASVLGRTGRDEDFNSHAPFFEAVRADPILSHVVLIAEPWDTGTYQVGNFPTDWSEWNGRFRDTVRKFVKGDDGQIADLGRRLTGSADLYGDEGRTAFNSVNFITCHDGFTLHDLVAYNGKHNEANGEDNRDGSDDNNSWNCGAEGPTDDSEVLELRKQLVKNHLCLLLFSAGTPMLLGGDEFLRTQGGNNNAYCQDNEISWYDWTLADVHRDMLDFATNVITLTRRFKAFQHRKEALGDDNDSSNATNGLAWFGADGATPDWSNPTVHTLCYRLDTEDTSPRGAVSGVYAILNADHQNAWITLPALPDGLRWHRVIDTCLPAGEDFAAPGHEVALDPSDHYLASARTVVILAARAS